MIRRLLNALGFSSGETQLDRDIKAIDDYQEQTQTRMRILQAHRQNSIVALRQARVWFQGYADHHDAKGDVDKAKRNQDRADYCQKALDRLINDKEEWMI